MATPSDIPARPRPLRRLTRIGGVLLTAAALTMTGVAVAPGAAAAVAPRSGVVGHVEVVRASHSSVRVAGWSVDRARPAASNSENVVVDGRMAALPLANRARADVNRALRISGRHGFDVTVPARPGLHSVCVISRAVPDLGGRPVVLSCHTVRVTR